MGAVGRARVVLICPALWSGEVALGFRVAQFLSVTGMSWKVPTIRPVRPQLTQGLQESTQAPLSLSGQGSGRTPVCCAGFQPWPWSPGVYCSHFSPPPQTVPRSRAFPEAPKTELPSRLSHSLAERRTPKAQVLSKHSNLHRHCQLTSCLVWVALSHLPSQNSDSFREVPVLFAGTMTRRSLSRTAGRGAVTGAHRALRPGTPSPWQRCPGLQLLLLPPVS